MKTSLRTCLLLLPVMALLMAYAPTKHFFANQYDDAYITYRYAILLAEGHGLVFNTGERTDAASSFLYTLLLSGSWLMGGHNLEWISGLIGVGSLALVCLLVYHIALLLSQDERASILCALACGFNGFLAGWTLSGMEVLPWTAMIVGAIYLLLRRPESPIAITLMIAAAAFTRLEGIFLLLPLGFTLLQTRAPWRAYIPPVALGFAFVIFYVAKHQYYGVWISHAFQMKKIAAYYQAAPQELLDHWLSFASIPFLLGCWGLVKKKQFAIAAYLGLSLASLALGPKSDWALYSVHLLPIFYGFAAVALSCIRSHSQGKFAPFVFIAVAILMLGQSVKAAQFNRRNMTNLAEHQVCRKALGQYIAKNISPSEHIASSDLGAIAYFAIEHRFVDLIALTSSDVLDAYAHERNADGILDSKKVRWMADTFVGPDNRLEVLLMQFPHVLQPTSYMAEASAPIHQCQTSPSIQFLLTPLRLKGTVPTQALGNASIAADI